MIYLDSNATACVDPQVVEAMLPFLREHYANPSSSYASAREVREAVERARRQVAELIGAQPQELIFTSGGTEALNAVIESVRRTIPRPRLIVGATEHPAVMEPARRWAKAGGPVSVAPVDGQGLLKLDALREILQAGDTGLVAVMWANNETGVVSPIREVVELAHAAGALVLCDAVQAVGKIPLDVRSVPVDFLALSGHKFHAPKGVGALYVSRRVRFEPWLLGGGQEDGRRSGTENVPSIVGLGLAAALMKQNLSDGGEIRVAAMRDAFEARVLSACRGAAVNGSRQQRLPTTTSIRFPGLVAAEMLILLDQRGVCCSAGSACHTAAVHPSPVLEAMGFSASEAACTLRFSFSRFNTMEEAHQAAGHVIEVEKKLRQLADEGGGPVVLS